MIRKVEEISGDISDKLSKVPAVDCILLQESAEKDLSNPYFLSVLMSIIGELFPIHPKGRQFLGMQALLNPLSSVRKTVFYRRYPRKNRV